MCRRIGGRPAICVAAESLRRQHLACTRQSRVDVSLRACTTCAPRARSTCVAVTLCSRATYTHFTAHASLAYGHGARAQLTQLHLSLYSRRWGL